MTGWVEDLRDLCIDRVEEGELVVKQEELVVLSEGQWPVVAIVYRQWDRKIGGLGDPRLSLRRFRRLRHGFKQECVVNLGSQEAIDRLREILDRLDRSGGAGS